MVECGGLENRYVGNPGVGGSNPPLSAEARRCAACRTLGPSGYACQHTTACGLRLSARFSLAAVARQQRFGFASLSAGRLDPSRQALHPPSLRTGTLCTREDQAAAGFWLRASPLGEACRRATVGSVLTNEA